MAASTCGSSTDPSTPARTSSPACASGPSAGHWTDVRVKERNLPSLFGSVGLPLSRNGARARIEIRPAISGHQFLPLAVPNNVITKVQVRYYDECRDSAHASPLATLDLAPLPAANQGGVPGVGGAPSVMVTTGAGGDTGGTGGTGGVTSTGTATGGAIQGRRLSRPCLCRHRG